MKVVTFIGLMFVSLLSYSAEVVDISAEELQNANSRDWLILDVRTAEEYAAGHVPGAVNVPHTALASQIESLSVYKGRPVVVYCRSGRRAGIAADILQANAFVDVRHLEGDMSGWTAADMPVEKD